MAGDGPRILLLHGVAATGAVWTPLAGRLRGAAQVWAPDLPGHGNGPRCERYNLAALAAAVSRYQADVVAGHSLGGYVALALAGGGFGHVPRVVVSLGARQRFTSEERAKAAELARRPARAFATYGEALERYRLVSGLNTTVAPDEAVLARGVRAAADGYMLATDPAVLGIEVTPFVELVAQAHCPVVLARGEHDPIVTAAEQSLPGVRRVELAGCGHNAQVEDPASFAALLMSL